MGGAKGSSKRGSYVGYGSSYYADGAALSQWGTGKGHKGVKGQRAVPESDDGTHKGQLDAQLAAAYHKQPAEEWRPESVQGYPIGYDANTTCDYTYGVPGESSEWEGYVQGDTTYGAYDETYAGYTYDTTQAQSSVSPAHDSLQVPAKGRKRGAKEQAEGRYDDETSYSREISDEWSAYSAKGDKGRKGKQGKRWSQKDTRTKGHAVNDTHEGYVELDADTTVPGAATEPAGYDGFSDGSTLLWYRQAARVIDDVVQRFTETCLPSDTIKTLPLVEECVRDFRRFVQYIVTCYREQGPLDTAVFSRLCERFVTEWPELNVTIDPATLSLCLAELNLVQWTN